MKNNFLTILYAFFGFIGVQSTDFVIPSDPADIDRIVKIIVQILIGIATIVQMFRNRKSK